MRFKDATFPLTGGIPARTICALLDVRDAVQSVTNTGTVSYSTPYIAYSVRVPFWRIPSVCEALRHRMPTTTVFSVGPLSLRDHFRLKRVEVRL